VTGRKKTPPLQAEREALIRVASLAAAALVQLRKPGRGKYESERQLAGWIKDAGVQFSASDLGPALGLAEATGRLVRPAVGPNTPRPGELATSGALARDAELYANAELPDKARVAALIDGIIRVLSSVRCDEEELADRLAVAGVVYREEDLGVALERLMDSGRLMAPRPRPTGENPNPQRVLIMANLPAGYSQSGDRFSDIDELAAAIHACVRKSGDFRSDDQLVEWLAEEEIGYEPERLRDALEQLEVSGWLSRPHRNRDWPSDPLPGYLIAPSWAR
jgi:hypothetical protein